MEAVAGEAGSDTELISEPVVAPGTPLRIEWSGPEACGKSSALEEETQRLLGDLALTAGVLVHARAMRLDDGRFRIDLHLFGAVHGERSLESSKCSEALQAAAVVLALAVNADALIDEEPPEPVAVAPSPSEPPRTPAPAPEETLHGFFLSPGIRLSGGIAPFPHWGAELTVGFDAGLWRALARGFVEPTTEHGLIPTGRYALQCTGGSVGACLHVLEGPTVDPRICGGIGLTHLRVSPSGLDPNRRQQAFIWSPRVGAELSIALNRHVALEGGSYLEVPTTTPRFVVDNLEGNSTVAHDVSLGGVFSLGLEFLF